MSNIHGLHSNRSDDKDDDEEESNNRYVGGVDARGGGSGLAVEPNTSDAAPRDSVFDLAEQASGGDGEERPRRTITMYRNGFQVDDGPYRRLDDPANADFLRSLAAGRTPRELLEEGDVTVGLIDKRTEDYVERFTSFSGAGTSLGSTSAAASTDGVVDPAILADPPAVDESSPTTSIQIRLMNGQRRVVKINTNATVLQLASHLRSDSDQPFRLVTGFPPKPITDLSQTLEECGLKGAQVMQKPA